jgi:DNA-binding response OmpR family regulator
MSDQTRDAPGVLIIENDFLVSEMIHDMVTELGYQVTHVAHRFGSALREISKENFDSVCCGA